jgi:hypothetical protein
MLTISQYGIQLTRLQFDEIELVRQWRNQDFVVDNMDYKKKITKEEQEKWFHSINNKYNYYFIIKWQNKKIGIINAKNYNPELGFGEGGIFIGEKEYLNSIAPTFATLCLLNVVFLVIKLTNISRVKILNSNLKSIEYNKLLGYKLMQESNDGISSYFELTLENYVKYGSKLNQAAKLTNHNNDEIHIIGTPSDINLEEINKYLINQTAR